ncbi:MAG: hypothetical protein J6J44_11980 [Lachnospiraceae bacterium]|nr:hypothetical protein [Lachnospiraceae bacterium]
MKNTKQGASIYFNNFPYLYPCLSVEKGDMEPDGLRHIEAGHFYCFQ